MGAACGAGDAAAGGAGPCCAITAVESLGLAVRSCGRLPALGAASGFVGTPAVLIVAEAGGAEKYGAAGLFMFGWPPISKDVLPRPATPVLVRAWAAGGAVDGCT